jgi:hypothetical protein
MILFTQKTYCNITCYYSGVLRSSTCLKSCYILLNYIFNYVSPAKRRFKCAELYLKSIMRLQGVVLEYRENFTVEGPGMAYLVPTVLALAFTRRRSGA